LSSAFVVFFQDAALAWRVFRRQLGAPGYPLASGVGAGVGQPVALCQWAPLPPTPTRLLCPLLCAVCGGSGDPHFQPLDPQHFLGVAHAVAAAPRVLGRRSGVWAEREHSGEGFAFFIFLVSFLNSLL